MKSQNFSFPDRRGSPFLDRNILVDIVEVGTSIGNPDGSTVEFVVDFQTANLVLVNFVIAIIRGELHITQSWQFERQIDWGLRVSFRLNTTCIGPV